MEGCAMVNIPAWARGELDILGARDSAPVIERWGEIESGVLPHLQNLTDAQKGYVLRIAIGLFGDYGGNITKEVRQQRRRLKEINEDIRKHAKALAKALRTQREYKEKGHVSDRQPDLWELIEAAAQNYPVWEYVAHGKIRNFFTARQEFLRIATDQSAPGPDLKDVLDGLELYYGDEYAHSSALHTRQAGLSDYVRLILGKLENYKRSGTLPHSFSLPDSALATLGNVAFNIPNPRDKKITHNPTDKKIITEDAVRKIRRRWAEPGTGPL